jgi:transcriptional regulator with PAS, ATPase and Fis domain
MPEGEPFFREARSTAATDMPTVTHVNGARVNVDTLARVPSRQLARLLLERAAEDPALLSRLYSTIDTPPSAPPLRSLIIGDSPAMRHIATLLSRFEHSDDPVLITGESGTGKELLAREIHDRSHRAAQAFVAVNCSAIPAGLVASELFGYEKGAFTGAAARGIGQIELANGGTLFLDEIGDMPIDLQGHLLRFLQEGQIRRLGGRDVINLNVRIVAATNVRLAEAIADGRFREDLFYRLNVLPLQVPPLRDRPEDIVPLACHFLQKAARDFRRPMQGFTPEALDMLGRHRWPGNVRELMSVVRRSVVVGDGPMIDADALTGLEAPPPPPLACPRPGSPEERTMLLETLDRTQENITSAADALRVSRVTLYRMLRRHGINLKRGLAETPVTRRSRA